MIQLILNLIQPLAVVVFIIAGILSLILKQYHQGAINLCIALANFMIFYGGKFLK
ncbi:hypothetical protein LCGC14_2215910 [marine sediment metagenome]|uniref:Uncharacterized protein n=1 Tax=marine sediment metagenome TaxID=412755 RepID=A0A0F9DZV5_9ZZZZ